MKQYGILTSGWFCVRSRVNDRFGTTLKILCFVVNGRLGTILNFVLKANDRLSTTVEFCISDRHFCFLTTNLKISSYFQVPIYFLTTEYKLWSRIQTLIRFLTRSTPFICKHFFCLSLNFLNIMVDIRVRFS